MKRWVIGVLAWVALNGCGGTVEDVLGRTDSQWLNECETSDTCGGLSCLDGLCTRECDTVNTCGDLGERALCAFAQPSRGSAATSEQASERQTECRMSCSDDEVCPSGHYCSGGICRYSEDRRIAGDPCKTNADCESNLCSGMGCGAEIEGICIAEHVCLLTPPRELCTCDGQTIQSCPPLRFAHYGACEE